MMHSPELLKGTLQTIVLKILSDEGRMYGYEISQRVKELSDGRILLTEGALYPTLHRMESEGLVKTQTELMGKRVRKYYTLTSSGQASAVDKVREFSAFVQTMALLLKLQLA